MYRVAHISWDSYVRDILLILPNIKDEHFDEFYQKKIHEFNSLVDTTPIFPKKIIAKFQKYVKHIPNQYIKPAQINKHIVSLQTYIDQFKLENHTINYDSDDEANTQCCSWVCISCDKKDKKQEILELEADPAAMPERMPEETL
jgi:hypothetical protein